MDDGILYQMYEMMTEMEARFEEAKNDADFMRQVEAFREELKSKGFEGTDEELDGFIIWLSVAKVWKRKS